MLNTKLSTEARNAQLNAFGTLLNGGSIQLFDGKQPNSPEIKATTQKALAVLKFSPVAFGKAVDGTIPTNPIADDDSAGETGVATWARLTKADGTAVMDGSVGKKDANIIMAATNIQAGARVSISSITITLPQQGDK